MAEPNQDAESDQIRTWDEQVLNALMATPQGRFWMDRLLEFCGIGQELYHDDGDALGMAKRDGLAKAGRYIEVQLLDICPDRYLQMIRDRRARIGRQRKKLRQQEEGIESVSRGRTRLDDLADEQMNAERARQAAALKSETKE